MFCFPSLFFFKAIWSKNIIIFVDLKICSYICEQHLIIWMKKGLYNKAGKACQICKSIGPSGTYCHNEFLGKAKTCYFGDINEELPIAKATVSQHLKELKDAGLIQGEVEAPKVKYCINNENWNLAKALFSDFFGQCICKAGGCCD